jgi:hypothetical protein
LYCFYEFLSRYDLEHLGALYTCESHHSFIYAVLNDLRRKGRELEEWRRPGPADADATARGTKALVLAMMLHLANARKRALKVYDESWAVPLYPTQEQLQTGAHLEAVDLDSQDVLQQETLWEVSTAPRRYPATMPVLAWSDGRSHCPMCYSGILTTCRFRRLARVSRTGNAWSCSCRLALSK